MTPNFANRHTMVCNKFLLCYVASVALSRHLPYLAQSIKVVTRFVYTDATKCGVYLILHDLLVLIVGIFIPDCFMLRYEVRGGISMPSPVRRSVLPSVLESGSVVISFAGYR
jgi:hypothetical protein